MEEHHRAFDTPLEIETVEGEVVITGPNGLCASLTVSAAIESAHRLLKAAQVDEETYQKPLG